MTEEVIFPDGTIVTIDDPNAKKRHRGGIRTVDGTPIRVVRRDFPGTGRQTKRVGGSHWIHGWALAGESNVTMYLHGFKGEYKPGTRIVTDFDPTQKRRN